MIYLGNDYSYGALTQVLNHLVEINNLGETGYGEDPITERTRQLLLDKCGLEDGEVFFLTGGTQTNIVALDWFLRAGEGVLCAEGAHINVHEAGAIEATGHKVIPLTTEAGKLTAKAIERYMTAFFSDPTWQHMVVPGCVYLSQPTEIGTLYTLKELQDIREICDRFSLRLYVDGARLIYALGSEENDVTLQDLADFTDGFYIGGTKCGTLFGEALILPGLLPELEKKRLFGLIKRHGALLAKGWLAAAQFEVLFKEDLYLEVGSEAVKKALRLRDSLHAIGIKSPWQSPTNQQFFIIPTPLLEPLSKELTFDLWGTPGPEESTIRLVTDWHTTSSDLTTAITLIRHLYIKD
ncbi:MAG: low specificity L-threonine aldolase [Muribaculaceae bacterium]|nr:low specificity L-threonine aldolase [Muribaculaceae bacterium]